MIKIWKIKDDNINGLDIQSVYTESTLEGHEDVIRDVNWRPTKESNFDLIASGGDVSNFSLILSFFLKF